MDRVELAISLRAVGERLGGPSVVCGRTIQDVLEMRRRWVALPARSRPLGPIIGPSAHLDD